MVPGGESRRRSEPAQGSRQVVLYPPRSAYGRRTRRSEDLDTYPNHMAVRGHAHPASSWWACACRGRPRGSGGRRCLATFDHIAAVVAATGLCVSLTTRVVGPLDDEEAALSCFDVLQQDEWQVFRGGVPGAAFLGHRSQGRGHVHRVILPAPGLGGLDVLV